MADALDGAGGSAGVLVQAVLGRVPGKRLSGELLGGGVDLAGPQRPVDGGKYPNHCLLNSAGPASDLALELRCRPWSGRKRADQPMRTCELVVVQTCPYIFFHHGRSHEIALQQKDHDKPPGICSGS